MCVADWLMLGFHTLSHLRPDRDGVGAVSGFDELAMG